VRVCVCVCACCCVTECMCLTLCVPAGKRRGHMLKMKMDIYHHRELREGERRRRVVAGGNVTGEKEKMKNGGVVKGGALSLRVREGNGEQRKRLIAGQERALHPPTEENRAQRREKDSKVTTSVLKK